MHSKVSLSKKYHAVKYFLWTLKDLLIFFLIRWREWKQAITFHRKLSLKYLTLYFKVLGSFVVIPKDYFLNLSKEFGFAQISFHSECNDDSYLLCQLPFVYR